MCPFYCFKEGNVKSGQFDIYDEATGEKIPEVFVGAASDGSVGAFVQHLFFVLAEDSIKD